MKDFDELSSIFEEWGKFYSWNKYHVYTNDYDIVFNTIENPYNLCNVPMCLYM